MRLRNFNRMIGESDTLCRNFLRIGRRTFGRLLRYPSCNYDSAIDDRFHCLLQFCRREGTLDSVLQLHALTVTIGQYARQPVYFTNNLISLYGFQGDTRTARKLFNEMPHRNSVSYNVMISAYCRDGVTEECWELFMNMRFCGLAPTQFTFGSLLSCDGMDLYRGRALHSVILKNGLIYAESYCGTSLMGFLGRHRSVDDAIRVFDDMPVKSVVSWNSIIALLAHHGLVKESVYLFQEFMALDCGVRGSTLAGLLSGIPGREDLVLGDQLHCLVKKSGLDYEVLVSNNLLNMYVKCECIWLAEKLFGEMTFHDFVSYNTLISGLARCERPQRALRLLYYMVCGGVSPNEVTYVSVIKCCASLQILVFGEYIHAKVIRNSLHSEVYVGCALVYFYGKFKLPISAHQCFREIHNKNVVSWNALIGSFSNQCYITPFALLKTMLQLDLLPNEYTLSDMLRTLTTVQLQQLQSLTIKLGCQENEYVLSSLITAYANNGLLFHTSEFTKFDEMPLPVSSSNVIAAAYNRCGQYEKSLERLSVIEEPDVASWNIWISALSHKGDYVKVFELFKDMLVAQNYPNKYTIASVLCVCTNLCSLMLVRSVHGLVLKSHPDMCDTFVCNLLIDTYGKCGSIDDSLKLFAEIEGKNLFSWTTLISALGRNGYAWKALQKFKEMEGLGFKPDSVLFVSLMSACRHGGLVEEGLKLFLQMEGKYGVKPKLDHYHIVIDLLAKNGCLEEAERMIGSIPSSANDRLYIGGKQLTISS